MSPADPTLVSSIAELVKAFAELLWPLLAAAVAVRLMPAVMSAMRTGGVALRFGDTELQLRQRPPEGE